MSINLKILTLIVAFSFGSIVAMPKQNINEVLFEYAKKQMDILISKAPAGPLQTALMNARNIIRKPTSDIQTVLAQLKYVQGFFSGKNYQGTPLAQFANGPIGNAIKDIENKLKEPAPAKAEQQTPPPVPPRPESATPPVPPTRKNLPIPMPKQNVNEALIEAAKKNNENEIITLLAQKADPNYHNAQGESPLIALLTQLSIGESSTEAVEALIKAGANIHEKVTQEGKFKGKTPLWIAIHNREEANAQKLIKAGAKFEPHGIEATDSGRGMIDYALRFGAAVNLGGIIYKSVKVLGAGDEADVLEIIDPQGKKFAIKIYSAHKVGAQKRELLALEKANKSRTFLNLPLIVNTELGYTIYPLLIPYFEKPNPPLIRQFTDNMERALDEDGLAIGDSKADNFAYDQKGRLWRIDLTSLHEKD